MYDVIYGLCHLFDDAITEEYGIHALILWDSTGYEDLYPSYPWRCFTPSDFCEYVILKLWGVNGISELYECIETLPYDIDVKIVYPWKGYEPGHYYEK